MDHIPPWQALVESALLAVLMVQDILAGLLLRKRTGLGQALSRFMLVMGVTWLGALLTPVLPEVFLSPVWYWGLRIALIWTATHALQQVMVTFGGPKAALRLIWGNWSRWVLGPHDDRRRGLDDQAPVYLALGIAALLALGWVLLWAT